MSEYAVARLEDIGEISDVRERWRPVRHHFGITSFGINTWTGRETGDKIINEHDEEGEDEELYFVQRADQARDLAAAHPEYPALLYNLACCESLAGRKADAIEHLRLAIATSDSFRSYLAKDSDLDPLREEPEFKALTAG